MLLVVCKNCRRQRRTKATRRYFTHGFCTKRCEAAFRLRSVRSWPEKKDFYLSRGWIELRYKILKSRGRTCSACKTTDGVMHVDHIKPRSKYKHLELTESNLQVLCKACNEGKGAWDETDWRTVK